MNSWVVVKIGSLSREFGFRPGTSDPEVIKQVFVKRSYNIKHLRRYSDIMASYNAIISQGKTPLIVDAGANIGASPLFFCGVFPAARVVAIEPERENYRLLDMNTRGLKVTTLHAAVSSASGAVDIVDPGEGHWGYRARREEDLCEVLGTVPCVTIDHIYKSQTDCLPFITKIDIEGGERDLFSSNTEWVAATPLIIVELHDWMLCGTANSRNFLKCVSEQDRDFVYLGENIFSISNSLVCPHI